VDVPVGAHTLRVQCLTQNGGTMQILNDANGPATSFMSVDIRY
jgi:hypothetical protein